MDNPPTTRPARPNGSRCDALQKMFTVSGLEEFAKSLARLNNLPLETAGHYAALIGDTPEEEEDGRVVVRTDAGEILARVRVPDEYDEYFQCIEGAEGWEYQVGRVWWVGHEPETRWITYRRWRSQPDETRLARAKAAALADPRFFRTCSLCWELNNAGHMHNKEVCQSCAGQQMGVVH